MTLRILPRQLLVSGVMLSIAVMGCFTDPGGGGNQHESRMCRVGSNSAFQNASGLVSRALPLACPFVVRSPGDTIAIAVFIDLPKSQIGGGFGFGSTQAFVLDTQSRLAASGIFPFNLVSPGRPDYVRAEPFAIFTDASPTGIRDSLESDEFVGQSPEYLAQAWAVILGDTSSVHPTVSGSAQLAVGETGAYVTHTDWDTTMYSYQWLVNGAMTSQTSATFIGSFSSAALNTLSSIVVRADSTADTVTKSIDTRLTVYIVGLTSMQPGQTTTFTSTIRGGSPPYQYSWTVGGDASGSSTGPTVDVTAGSSDFGLTLVVTDAAGRSVAGYSNVSVGGCGTQLIC